MQIHHSRRLQIDLQQYDIETFKEIVLLAHTQLCNSPAIQMHGYPGKKQAGLSGPELCRVKEMLEQFGFSIGVEFPFVAEPQASYPVAMVAA